MTEFKNIKVKKMFKKKKHVGLRKVDIFSPHLGERQTDRQTDRQSSGEAEIEIEQRLIERQTDRDKDNERERQAVLRP